MFFVLHSNMSFSRDIFCAYLSACKNLIKLICMRCAVFAHYFFLYRGLWGWSTCQWTRVRHGTWPSCPLLATSSSTLSWQRMMKWSSCMLTSREVSPYSSFMLFLIILCDKALMLLKWQAVCLSMLKMSCQLITSDHCQIRKWIREVSKYKFLRVQHCNVVCIIWKTEEGEKWKEA